MTYKPKINGKAKGRKAQAARRLFKKKDISTLRISLLCLKASIDWFMIDFQTLNFISMHVIYNLLCLNQNKTIL